MIASSLTRDVSWDQKLWVSAGVHSTGSNRSSDGFSSQCPLTSQRHKMKTRSMCEMSPCLEKGFLFCLELKRFPGELLGEKSISHPIRPLHPHGKNHPELSEWSSPPLGNLENQKRDEDAGRKSAGFPAHSNGRNKYANVLAFASNTSCLEFFSSNGH